MTILEAIYNGELYPAETVVPNNSKYTEAKKAMTVLLNELQESMSEEQFAKVSKLYDTIFDAEAVESLEQFSMGLQSGCC